MIPQHVRIIRKTHDANETGTLPITQITAIEVNGQRVELAGNGDVVLNAGPDITALNVTILVSTIGFIEDDQ